MGKLYATLNVSPNRLALLEQHQIVVVGETGFVDLLLRETLLL